MGKLNDEVYFKNIYGCCYLGFGEVGFFIILVFMGKISFCFIIIVKLYDVLRKGNVFKKFYT